MSTPPATPCTLPCLAQFMPTSYESRGNDWLFKGSFELELSALPSE